MRMTQKVYTKTNGWDNRDKDAATKLVFVFGDRALLEDPERTNELARFFPEATLLMGSTSGNIIEDEVKDEVLVATAIALEQTPIQSAQVNIADFSSSREAGLALAEKLQHDDLKHVFVLSDGHNVNGTDLVDALNEGFGGKIPFTGGLAGDGTNFQKTVVGLNETPAEGVIALVGFYGDAIHIDYGCNGGWKPFGIERTITKATNNVLYEISGKSALEIYKTYLGDAASELPASSLHFPLGIQDADGSWIVRTILAIDEDEKSMTFAGNMPTGATVRLMRSTSADLANGAEKVAEQLSLTTKPNMAICVSCVGRRIIMGSRVDEELLSIRDGLGEILFAGFYSYGEIAPFANTTACKLHNQTMTITTFRED